MSQLQLLATEKIEALIAQGKPVVVHEGYALDLSGWIDRHPGGRLSILHMVGRDATDEITVYVYYPSTTYSPPQFVPAYMRVVVVPSSRFRESQQTVRLY